MKIVRVALTGELTPGDEILLHTISPRGGRTTAGAKVEEDRAVIEGNAVRRVKDNVANVVERLRLSAERFFLSDSYRFSTKENVLRIECQDAVSDATLVGEVLGKKTEKLTVEEL